MISHINWNSNWCPNDQEGISIKPCTTIGECTLPWQESWSRVGFFLLNTRRYFYRSFRLSPKLGEMYTIPTCPLPYPKTSPNSSLHQCGIFVSLSELTQHHQPKSMVSKSFIFCIVFYDFDKTVITWIDHCSIKQNNSITLKICDSLIHSSLLPNSWQPLIFFTVSIILPFSECWMVEIIVCSLQMVSLMK